MVGRIDAWLGPDGKGMMDAFTPADHDLGVQTFGTLDEAEAEKMVLTFTEITRQLPVGYAQRGTERCGLHRQRH